jgi:tRNA(Ile)-lysidine synthase
MVSLPSTRATGAFERRVRRALELYVQPDEPLVIACSGGPDSTATLVSIARVRKGGRGVIAAHFDHGLRSRDEAAGDRAAVIELARGLDVPVVSGEAHALNSASEAAAREARYRWLASACVEAGARWCATGHTLDDQAETVLLRLTRGSGLGGAAAMAAAAPWPLGGASLRVVRPLLSIRRAEAGAYLDALGIEARSDPSNAHDSFDRNRIRHRVLPELRSVNPRAEEALARFADLARADNDALEAWGMRAAVDLVRHEARAAVIDRAGLRALPAAIASRVVRQAAATLDVSLEAGQVDSVLRLAARRGSQLSLERANVTVFDSWIRLARVDVPGAAT